MISMAVALAPAYAQQTVTQGAAGSTSIQPKSDTKAMAPVSSSKPATDVKADKSAPPKTGTDVKNKGASGEPSADVKAGSAATKTDASKEIKGTTVKPGASVKSDKPEKSASAQDAPKHHVKESVGKVASGERLKSHTSNQDGGRKAGNNESTNPVISK